MAGKNSNKTTFNMHVYRFGNMVAVNPPRGATFYITYNEAFDTMVALAMVLKDMERAPADSQVRTQVIEINRDPREYMRDDFKLDSTIMGVPTEEFLASMKINMKEK